MTQDDYRQMSDAVNGSRKPEESPGDEPGLTWARIALASVAGLACWVVAIWLITLFA